MRLGLWAALGAVIFGSLATPVLAASLDFRPRAWDRAQEGPLREGDFDNDGRVDQVLILPDAETGRFQIMIRFNRLDGAQTQRVMTLGAEAFAPEAGMALQVVPAGRYVVDCGDYSDGCDVDVIDAAADSLRLSMGGANVLMYWNGERFIQDFVKSDVPATDRVLGLLGSLNP